MDMIAADDSASQVSDKIKDMLYAKSTTMDANIVKPKGGEI